MTDRELDALVAQEIMRWTPIIEKVKVPIPGHIDVFPGGPFQWAERKVFLRPDGGRTQPFEYTTDIAAAWSILEAYFPAPSWYILVRTTDTGNWRCDIEHNYQHGPTYSAFDKSAPRAIVLAALKAKGIDV